MEKLLDFISLCDQFSVFLKWVCRFFKPKLKEATYILKFQYFKSSLANSGIDGTHKSPLRTLKGVTLNCFTITIISEHISNLLPANSMLKKIFLFITQYRIKCPLLLSKYIENIIPCFARVRNNTFLLNATSNNNGDTSTNVYCTAY